MRKLESMSGVEKRKISRGYTDDTYYGCKTAYGLNMVMDRI